MRFTSITTFAALLAGLALGQLDLPDCANKCVTDFTSGSQLGGCELVNIKCICEKKAFLDTIACCLTEKCATADQAKAASEALKFCAIVGATNLPTAVVCSSTASATSSATGAAVATPSVTTAPNAAVQNIAGLGAGVLGAFAAVLL